MDDELLYGCWQGQWIRAQIDVSENASRECEHKPSCTLVADSGWVNRSRGTRKLCRAIGLLPEEQRQAQWVRIGAI
jgi:hypothetical protein